MMKPWLFWRSALLLLMLSPFAHAADARPEEDWKNVLPFYNDDWSLYFQSTAIVQGYPSYNAAYSGAASLSSSAQTKHTESATAFIGRRLWEGGALYIDPEAFQGYGLSDTLGMAGFPNGEAQKAGTTPVAPYIARIFLRQTFGFGGGTETLARGPNQVHDVADVSRLTVTVGKFSYTDMFDDNTYSHDARSQFMNWALIDSAAWDYAADARGYSWGGVLDFNQKNWALRLGSMLPTDQPNGYRFQTHGVDALSNALELEERYSLMDRPGKTRFLLFYTRADMGSFSEALATQGDINSAIADTRSYGRSKFGFAVNAEQQLRDDLGAFLRLSSNDGRTEDWMYTQVDQSLAAGLSLQGKSWGRDDDVAGLAVAVNGISAEQREALKEGYVGILIGDGNLAYAPESILEAYYAYKITSYATFTPDYQFVLDPAYNRDRGPVNIFAGRLHVEF